MGFLATAFLLAGLFVNPAAKPDFFPLAVGNQWTLRSNTSETITIEVLESRQQGGITWYLVSGYANGPRWVRTSSSGELFALNDRNVGEIQTESLLAHLAPGAGGYRTGLGGCKQAAQPAAAGVNALAIGYEPGSCVDGGITQETYSPGVGLTRRSVTTGRGELTYELVTSRLR